MDELYRAWAEIDLGALADNFAAVQKRQKDKKIYAVIKADAYGHGAVEAARVLKNCGAYGFAVSNIAEAEELRLAGITEPILILGYTPPVYAPSLSTYDIEQCVYSLEYAHVLNEAATGKIKVHLKLDTGMGRIGFDCRNDATSGLDDAKKVLSLENLQVSGVFMHFSVADTPDQQAFTENQYRLFLGAVKALEDSGHKFEIRHCLNSAGILTLLAPETDAARAGIILYGLAPSEDMPLTEEFKPVMSLYSAVSLVKTVESGESVSYGRTYRAEGVRTIATVCAGYADGVPRRLSNRGYVLINGEKAPIVGRVCMDQLCVDVTGIENVKMGDRVTIFGDGLSVDTVAQLAGTINYEIVCGISKRVPRIYK